MVPPQQVVGPRIVNLEVGDGVSLDIEVGDQVRLEETGQDPGAAIVGLVVQGILESLTDTSIAAIVSAESTTMESSSTATGTESISESTTEATVESTTTPRITTTDVTNASTAISTVS